MAINPDDPYNLLGKNNKASGIKPPAFSVCRVLAPSRRVAIGRVDPIATFRGGGLVESGIQVVLFILFSVRIYYRHVL